MDAQCRVGSEDQAAQFLRRLLSERETANYLGVKVSWLRLRRWRKTSEGLTEGPPWVEVGKFIKYDLSDLDQWIAKNKRHGASAA